VRIIFKFLW